MQKALLLAFVVLGLVLVATPQTEACHTHGYVRASTLNDLFSGAPNGSVTLSAGNDPLNNASLDTANYDDSHQFTWSANGDGGAIDFGATDAANFTGNAVYTQLEGIIGDIELALDAQYDRDYAD